MVGDDGDGVPPRLRRSGVAVARPHERRLSAQPLLNGIWAVVTPLVRPLTIRKSTRMALGLKRIVELTLPWMFLPLKENVSVLPLRLPTAVSPAERAS